MSEPKITEIPLTALVPDKRNANKGTDRGRQALRHSLETFGAGRSILLAADGTVLAGNKTYEQAAALGHEQVLVVETDGSRLVAVKRTDLESDSDEARSLALADNRVGQLDLDFDPAAIDAALADGLDLSAYFSGDELEELLRGLEEPGGGAPQEGAGNPGAFLDRYLVAEEEAVAAAPAIPGPDGLARVKVLFLFEPGQRDRLFILLNGIKGRYGYVTHSEALLQALNLREP